MKKSSNTIPTSTGQNLKRNINHQPVITLNQTLLLSTNT
jgi:hypothetical protein